MYVHKSTPFMSDPVAQIRDITKPTGNQIAYGRDMEKCNAALILQTERQSDVTLMSAVIFI